MVITRFKAGQVAGSLRAFHHRAERAGAPILHVAVALGLALATVAVAASAAREIAAAQQAKIRPAPLVKKDQARFSETRLVHATPRRSNIRDGVYVVAGAPAIGPVELE